MTARPDEAHPLSTPEEIDRVETATGFAIGPVLRAQLLGTRRGAGGENGFLRLPDRSTVGAVDYLPASRMVTAWNNVGLGCEFLPFARDAAGNFLVVDRAEQVLFWDKDFATTLGLGFSLAELASRFEVRPPATKQERNLRRIYAPAARVVDAIEGDVDPGGLIEASNDARLLESALSLAVEIERPDMVRTVLRRGRDLAVLPALHVGRAMATAALRSRAEALLGAFVAEQIDIDTPEERGLTTLMRVAISVRRPELARWLLEHGADPCRHDRRGRTVKQIALEAGNASVAAVLP